MGEIRALLLALFHEITVEWTVLPNMSYVLFHKIPALRQVITSLECRCCLLGSDPEPLKNQNNPKGGAPGCLLEGVRFVWFLFRPPQSPKLHLHESCPT